MTPLNTCWTTAIRKHWHRSSRRAASPDIGQLGTSLAELLPFDKLRTRGEMAGLLADAIAAQKKILVVADYDADGATLAL